VERAVAEPGDMGTALREGQTLGGYTTIRTRRTALTTTIRLLKMRRKLTLSKELKIDHRYDGEDKLYEVQYIIPQDDV
jgi:hypothetical protein